MTQPDPIFYHKDGELFWRDWCWGNDEFARARMERQAEFLSSGKAYCPQLAEECWQALRAFDEFWSEQVDA